MCSDFPFEEPVPDLIREAGHRPGDVVLRLTSKVRAIFNKKRPSFQNGLYNQ